jgi:amino acid transporter
MDKERRKTLITVLIEIGKFTTGGLVIGYFVSPRPISETAAIWGAILALACFALAVLVSKEQ